jgi:hypothetical protein
MLVRAPLRRKSAGRKAEQARTDTKKRDLA